MAKKFFKNMPTVQYANNIARNLLTRVQIDESVRQQLSAFYPYEMPDHKRGDVLAFQYYDDPYMDWLVYLSNGVVDPYYDQYLSYNQLSKHITKKYGSVYNARSKIKHYEINWADQTVEKTPAEWAALPTNHKKYWAPLLDEFDNIAYYVRKELEATKRTNKLIAIAVDDPSGYTLDENVEQTTGSVVDARGNVDYANTTHIVLKHITGSFANNVAVTGVESGHSQTSEGVVVLSDDIPDDEFVYWSAVTYFDYEDSLNEQRKSIRLLNSAYADQAYENLKMLMK